MKLRNWVAPSFLALVLVVLLACDMPSLAFLDQQPTPEPTLVAISVETDVPTAAPTNTPRPTATATWVIPQVKSRVVNPPAPSSTPNYRPPSNVQNLASAATMTDHAKTIFYATNPVVDTDRVAFDKHCNAPVSGNVAELGCYTSDNHIYILSITDPELSGEMIVTAAHEMLHAAYAQLSDSQRTAVNAQVETAAAGIRSADLSRTMQIYSSLEPGERDNELHSILGTEYVGLGSALEQYYTQYFVKRSAIVGDAQHFDQVFAQLDSTLNSLQSQIAQVRTQMRTDMRSHNISGYNALVPQLNSLVQQYNQTVVRYNSLSRALRGEESTASTQ